LLFLSNSIIIIKECLPIQYSHDCTLFVLYGFDDEALSSFLEPPTVHVKKGVHSLCSTMPLFVANNADEFVLSTSSSNLDYDGSHRVPPSTPPFSPSLTTTDASPQKPVKKVIIIKQQPMKGEVVTPAVLSAMPDPLNKKWHDSCYYLVSPVL
jgi:hypothetical protein